MQILKVKLIIENEKVKAAELDYEAAVETLKKTPQEVLYSQPQIKLLK